MLHPKIEIALDEIDAAVINGDTFHDADERAKLLGFVARWTRALAARVGTRTERPPLTDDHLTEIVAANLGCSPEHRTEALEMALEIQQHRAADLSPMEIDALSVGRHLLAELLERHLPWGNPKTEEQHRQNAAHERVSRVLPVLDKILAANGGAS